MVMPVAVVADETAVTNAKQTAIEQTKLTVQRISTMLDTPSERTSKHTSIGGGIDLVKTNVHILLLVCCFHAIIIVVVVVVVVVVVFWRCFMCW